MLRLALDPTLLDRHLFIIYAIAVFIAAAFGGAGPGFFAYVLSALSAAYFFLPPKYELIVSQPADQGGLVVFSLASFAIIALAHALRQSRIIAERQAEALGASEERTLLTIRNALDAAVGMDTGGRITEWNPAAESMFGLTAEEAVGAIMSEVIIPHRYRESHERGLRRFLDTGEGTIFDHRLRLHGLHRDGREFPVELTVSVIKGQGGISFSAFIRDVTAEEQLASVNEELRERLAEVQKLADIVESSDDAIISVTLDGTITNWNKAAERIFGYSGKEITGQRLEVLIPAERRKEFTDLRNRLLQGDHSGHFDTVRIRKDGSEVDVQIGAAPIRNASGEIVGISLIDREITERRLAEKVQRQLLEAIESERNRLNDLLATVPGVVWEAWGEPDQDHQRIDFVSDYVEKMVGYKVSEWLSVPNFWLKIVHPEDRESAAASAAATFKGREPGNNQFRWIAKDGHVVWVGSYSISIRNDTGEPIGMRGVTLDITDLKEAELKRVEAEEALRRVNTELERRVVERTAELSAANAELEAFSYSVSHDLRAPLRALDGFSRILIEDYGPKLDEEGRGHLDRIRLASQRMGHLIEDLLDMAYVTRTEMRRERVNLTEMLLSICQDLNSRPTSHKVEFEVESAMIVEADSRLLKAAMENLLQNAWKFTAKAAQAKVQAGKISKDGKAVYFIKDNGAGFDPNYVGKLFQPFQRLHSMTEYSGTGIGLATVKRIIERHGGSVWAEGELDKGATFFFTL